MISWRNTSWLMPGALSFVQNKQGGEFYNTFSPQQILGELTPQKAAIRWPFDAACGPLAPVQPQSVGTTHHG
jgi:hypothetical protein